MDEKQRNRKKEKERERFAYPRPELVEWPGIDYRDAQAGSEYRRCNPHFDYVFFEYFCKKKMQATLDWMFSMIISEKLLATTGIVGQTTKFPVAVNQWQYDIHFLRIVETFETVVFVYAWINSRS